VKYERDPATNMYSWIYTGGCFKDNKPIHYEDVSPNDKVTFKDVQIEVRRDFRSDDIDEEQLQQEEEENSSMDDTMNELEYYEGDTPLENESIKKEKPAEKIKRERESLNQQK